MTTTELLLTIQNALATDRGLTAWCTQQFGKAHKVFLGIDEQHPPQADDYPLVVVTGVSQIRGEGQYERQWLVSIGVGLVNETVTTTDSTVTYDGMAQAETMRELAENCLYLERIASMSSEGETASESYHPLYLSYSAVTVKLLKSNRRAMP